MSQNEQIIILLNPSPAAIERSKMTAGMPS